MPARTSVVWTAEALADLDAIHAFIARNSPRYAAVVVERLFEAVDRLEAFPESGRIVPELDDPVVREVIYGAYRIVYELRADRVEINTVFRASRLFPWRPRADG